MDMVICLLQNEEASFEIKKRHVLLLAYQSLGIVYGDLSISPLYVYQSAFSGSLHHRLHQDEEIVFGVLSLIFWSLTVFPLLKHAVIMLSTDDNGEGNSFFLKENIFLDYNFFYLMGFGKCVIFQEELWLCTLFYADTRNSVCSQIIKQQMKNFKHTIGLAM